MDQPHDIWTFSDTSSIDHARTKFSGVSFTLSALYSLKGFFSVGAVIITPMNLTSKEDWDYEDEITFDDGSSEFATDNGFWKYILRSPWTYRTGAALNVGPVILSGDLEYIDYSQMSYRSEPPEDISQGEANFIIKDSFRDVLNYRIGGEVSIPFTGLKIRGGYGVVMSPLKQEPGLQETPLGKDRQIISGGLGMTFMNRFTVDIGVAMTSWEGETFDVIEKQSRELLKVMASFTYRM